MKIVTTYFMNVPNLRADIAAVSIALKPPLEWNGLQYKALAPKDWLLSAWKERHDVAHYTEHYRKEILDKLSADDVIRELTALTDHASEIALVCYEEPGQFCHRHLVADWLNQKGWQVEEYGEG